MGLTYLPSCHLIILAAGKGTRMQNELPKVLHPLMGKPLLHHVIGVAQSLKPATILAVLSPGLSNSPLPDGVTTVVQDLPLGTGHAVQIALNSLPLRLPDQDIVFILAADVPALLPSSLKEAAQAFVQDQMLEGVVLAMDAPLPHAYGRLIIEQGVLTKIVEHKEATQDQRKITLCNAGILAFRAGSLKRACEKLVLSTGVQEIYLTDVVQLIHQAGGKISYQVIDANEAHGVNTQADLSRLENILQARTRAHFLASGVRMPAPDTVYFSYDTDIEGGVLIEPYVVFGKGVSVKRNSIIHSFSYLEGCVLNEDATVGPFARLRPGTHLLKGSKVGNFVEVKNTTLGAYSKANHLAYLGDATVGSKSNIGAGVITCNYDGHKKWSTHIGDNVFIGSNAALIAPLKVGNDALIGAGSTITKDVKEGALAVGRSRQIDIEQGAFKRKSRLGIRPL